MTKYLFEIKNRLFLILLLWLFIVIVCYCYKEVLLFFLIKSYICVSVNSEIFYFIFTNVTEIFSIYFNIGNFISAQIAYWYVIYNIFIFLSPALFKKEYKYINFFFRLFSFFSFFSFFLSNYIIIPLTWHFFLSFKPLSFTKFVYFEAKLSEYLNFYTNVCCFCFLYCQIFSVIFFFYSDIYSKKSFVKIKKLRKLYYYFFVIFSTLLSPPEIITQILMSLSLLFAYEAVLFFWMYFVFLTELIR